MTALSRFDWLLVAAITAFWGINWPIMKIGVQDFPPLTFRVLSMLIGLPAIWMVARMQRAPLTLRRDQWLPVIGLTIPNMLIWHSLIVYAVKMLSSSGRAAILGYTMPVWAVLAGVVFFGDKVSARAWFGVACAFTGALLLLSSELASLAGQPLATVMILVAAAAWGYGTVVMQRSKIDLSTVALTFWMMSLTTLMMGLGAIAIERHDWRIPDRPVVAAILYNGIVIFGLIHAVWFRLARVLPPVASGISLMMIPVLGVFSGAWMLGETPHWQDYVAMLLIATAMGAVLLKPRHATPLGSQSTSTRR